MSSAIIDILTAPKLYRPLWNSLADSSPNTIKTQLRELYRTDLYALLRYGLRRPDTEHPWIFERCREVQRGFDGHLDLWAREHYKMLSVDTPILTANRGWTTHGALEVGDQVFSPSGAPVTVLAKTQVFIDGRNFELVFSDGAKLQAGASHLWKLRRKIKRRVSGSDLRRVEFVDEIVSTDEMHSRHASGARLDVGVSDALQYPVRQLPVHPYVLGVWLADGTSESGSVVCGDEEVFDRVRAMGQPVGDDIAPNKPNCTTRTFYGLVTALKAMGLHRNKHIPSDYLTASTHQRWELLRGLMDCDGHCNTRGTATFVSKHERIARQVYDLAAGLSLRPRIGQYENSDGYQYWQVRFQAHRDASPFHLPRKAARAIPASHYVGSRTVARITELPPTPSNCIQVEGGMYLAGRELIPTHNSTILTFAGSIFRIIRSHGEDAVDPREVTIGIFSHTKPIAKGFMRQIKYELESNEHLQSVFDDIFYANPRKESPKWTEDEGITVKRKSNPKEATVEAHGLVDGQPTSKHFLHRQYDDVVTLESVTTPDMIAKTTSAYEMSNNLGTEGGTFGVVGTRYHFADTYGDLMKRGSVTTRIHPCTKDGTDNFTADNCVLMKPETLRTKRIDQGPYTFGTQMLLNPKGDNAQSFKNDWIKFSYTQPTGEGMNCYILCDPANEKRRTSDYTTFWVIGLGPDGNYVALDCIRDRLNLTERTAKLFELHRLWKPKGVGYEKYGMQADIEHIRVEQDRKNYRFDIKELGGATPKLDRIKKLIPIFEQGRMYLRHSRMYTDYEGTTRNLIDVFIEEEFKAFPVMVHDDMLDCLARIVDPELKAEWPKEGMAAAMRPSQPISRPGSYASRYQTRRHG